MSLKKSNALLLGFYLTLLSCLITFLVLAKDFISENYIGGTIQKVNDDIQIKTIDRPIHHLIVKSSFNLSDLTMGSISKITYVNFADYPEETGIMISGDTLTINDDVAVYELLLENKLKSIRFEYSAAQINSSWLEQDAFISLIGSNEESNMLFYDAHHIKKLQCELIGSSLSIQNVSYNTMTIDSMRFDLYNASIDFTGSNDIKPSLIEVNSHHPYDRISASSEVLSKMRLVNSHSETIRK